MKTLAAGLDIKLNKHVAIRMIQLDDIRQMGAGGQVYGFISWVK